MFQDVRDGYREKFNIDRDPLNVQFVDLLCGPYHGKAWFSAAKGLSLVRNLTDHYQSLANSDEHASFLSMLKVVEARLLLIKASGSKFHFLATEHSVKDKFDNKGKRIPGSWSRYDLDILIEQFVFGCRADVASLERVAQLGANSILCLDDTLEDVEPESLGVEKIVCQYVKENGHTDKFDFGVALWHLDSLSDRKKRVLIQCRTGKKVAPGHLAGWIYHQEVPLDTAIKLVEYSHDVSVTDAMKKQLYEVSTSR